jgi:hypothetical protein
MAMRWTDAYDARCGPHTIGRTLAIAPPRRAANVTPPEWVPRAAKAPDTGLPVPEARAAAWLQENLATLRDWNEYVDARGIPLGIPSVLMAFLAAIDFLLTGFRPSRA